MWWLQQQRQQGRTNLAWVGGTGGGEGTRTTKKALARWARWYFWGEEESDTLAGPRTMRLEKEISLTTAEQEVADGGKWVGEWRACVLEFGLGLVRSPYLTYHSCCARSFASCWAASTARMGDKCSPASHNAPLPCGTGGARATRVQGPIEAKSL